jgi:rhamnosyltransferase
VKLNLAAVIVTYNPQMPHLEALLQQLLTQVGCVVVVDNASNAEVQSALTQLQLDRLTVQCLDENSGIATGQNTGLQLAFEEGCDAVVFFDQDSTITDNFIPALSTGLIDPHVSIAAPVFYDEQQGFGYPLVDILPSGRRKKYRPEELKGPIDVSVAISSGMLVRRSVFEQVGLLDERLFIDYVDTEWCLRCAAQGIAIRVIPAASMTHSIGDKSLSFAGFRVPVHSPVRRYYRIRNAFHLMRMEHVPWLMTVREVLFGLVHQIIMVAFEPDRKDYVFYYFKAVRDGVAGVCGPIKIR